MSFVSYAQNFEDVILRRVFRDVEAGFYVDIGAWDPVSDSVTKTFYDSGWQGINIEPGPVFAALAAARPRDINLNVAVSDRSGRMRLHVHRAGETVLPSSTLHDEPLPDIPGVPVIEEEMEVEVLPLAQILDHHAGGHHIHFLKIDAEGAEAAIIRGADWQRHRPEVLVIEATRPNTQERTHAEWEPTLLQNGYRFVLFDGLNAWYLREESAARTDAFRLPPNVFDNFRVAHDPAWERRLEASEEWGQSVQKALQQTQQHTVSLEQALQQAQQHNTSLEQQLQQTQQHNTSLEQALAQTREHIGALEGALQQARQRSITLEEAWQQAKRDLKRVTIGRAAEAARVAAHAHQIAELQESLAQHAAQLSGLAATLAETKEHLTTVAAERRALIAERWRLTQDLQFPSGPRVLRLTLPVARMLRQLFWIGRLPSPPPPPEIADLINPTPQQAAGERQPDPLQPEAPLRPVAETLLAPHAAVDGEVDARLARSVEAALLTLTLRGGHGTADQTSKLECREEPVSTRAKPDGVR